MRRLLDAMGRRISLLVGRAVLRALDDSGKTQRVQVEALAGELLGNVERLTEYGFTSVPKAGAEVVLVSVGGDRGHAVAITVADKRYRLTGLESGEVAIYDDLGQSVTLTRSGIVVDGGGRSVTVTNAASIELDADVNVTGTLTATVDVVGAGVSLATHIHSGVLVGGANTGAPV